MLFRVRILLALSQAKTRAERNKVYEIYGPLFFGSTTAFLEKFELEEDPKAIVLDFRESRIVDMSAIEALKKIVEKYENAGKSLTLRHLSSESIVILEQAKGFLNIPIEKGSWKAWSCPRYKA